MNTIELHAFMQLAELFRERGWKNPRDVSLEHEMSGKDLLALLEIEPTRVEVLFINHTAHPLDGAVVHPGDRVALVPPGVPGPHRFLLGFKNK